MSNANTTALQHEQRPEGAHHYIELFRIVAACAVVFTHVNMWAFLYKYPAPFWSLAICAATKFSVPTFMVIAAFLHTKSYERLTHYPSLISILKKKWHVLFLPFFMWNLIYLSVNDLTIQMPSLSAENIWGLLTGKYHLYFIFLLFQFFLLFHWFFKNNPSRPFSKAFAVCSLVTIAFYVVSEVLLWTMGPDNNFFEWQIGRAILGWGLFFGWGIVLAQNRTILQRIETLFWPLLALTILSYMGYFYEISLEYEATKKLDRLFFLLSGLCYQFFAGNLVLSICMRLTRNASLPKVLLKMCSVSQYTFGIYLAHNLFIPMVLRMFDALGLTWAPLQLVGVFLSTIFLCVLLERIVKVSAPTLTSLLFGHRKKLKLVGMAHGLSAREQTVKASSRPSWSI